MSTKIHTSAGYGGAISGTPTAKFKVNGTDLGYLFEGNKGTWVGGVFGDTFAKADPHAKDPAGGAQWRSPVMGRTSNTDFLERGIEWDNFAGSPNSGGKAKELFPYKHVGKRGQFQSSNFDAFTIIPNDIIQVPDGRYFGMGFRVKDWDADTGQAMAHTISNAWFWSDDMHAETWTEGRFAKNLRMLYEWGSNENRNKFFQNASFLMLPNDDRLYVFGSREGRKIGTGSEADGVYLRRAHYDQCFAHDTWEYFGYSGGKWQWGKNVTPTPILRPLTPGGFIGELNAQYIAGKVVLTYSDSGMGAVALTADRPDGVWSDPTVMVTRIQSPAQYAPSAHPWNKSLEDAYLHLSTWASVPNPVAIWDQRAAKMISLNYGTDGYRVSLVSEDVSESRSMSSQSLGLDTSDMKTDELTRTLGRIADASAEANPQIEKE